MKQIIFLFVVVCMGLAGCAPDIGNAVPPTATNPPALTSTPSPTGAVLPTEILQPTATPESPAIGQDLKYSEEYLAQFQNTEIKQVTVGGVVQDGLVGTYPDGSERILGLNIDGKMTRVGESTDNKGHKYYTYVNPDYDPLQRILPTEKTSEVLFDFFLKNLAEGQFRNETRRATCRLYMFKWWN